MNYTKFREAYKQVITESNDSELRNYIRSIVEEVIKEKTQYLDYYDVIQYFNGGKGYDEAMKLRTMAEKNVSKEKLLSQLNNITSKKLGGILSSEDAYTALENIVYPVKLSLEESED